MLGGAAASALAQASDGAGANAAPPKGVAAMPAAPVASSSGETPPPLPATTTTTTAGTIAPTVTSPMRAPEGSAAAPGPLTPSLPDSMHEATTNTSPATSVAAATAVHARPAQAPCADTVHALPWLPMRDAGFDAAVSACPQAMLSARLAARALIDTPAYYGTIGGEMHLAASFVLAPTVAVGFGFRALQYQFVQNAVIQATAASYGPLYVHAKVATDLEFGRRPVIGGVYIAAALPFTSQALDTAAGGGQLSGVLTFPLGDRLVVHGRFGLLVGASSSGGGTTVRAAGRGGADLAWRTTSWLDLLAGFELQGGWHRAFDHVLVRMSARGRVYGEWAVEGAIGVPLFGAERTDGVLSLGVTRDL